MLVAVVEVVRKRGRLGVTAGMEDVEQWNILRRKPEELDAGLVE